MVVVPGGFDQESDPTLKKNPDMTLENNYVRHFVRNTHPDPTRTPGSESVYAKIAFFLISSGTFDVFLLLEKHSFTYC